MTGGVFQASNSSDFSNAVTLATIAATPTDDTFTAIPINNPTSYRYLRYLSPNNGFGNVAEVEFFGIPVPNAPTGLAAFMANGTATLSWTIVSGATSYNVKRATSAGGPYTFVANVPSPSCSDSGLTPGATYYYVVTAVNESGEGTATSPLQVSDAYLSWILQQGWTPGAPGTGFDQDADGNGVSNGAEYLAPAGLSVVLQAGVPAVSVAARIDPAATVSLFKSSDLLNWTQVSLPPAADQSGIAAGFQRLLNQDSTTSPAQFYKLRVTR